MNNIKIKKNLYCIIVCQIVFIARRFAPQVLTPPPQLIFQGPPGLSPSPRGMHLMQGMASQNMPSINTIQSMHMLLISAYSRFLGLFQLALQSMTSPSIEGSSTVI